MNRVQQKVAKLQSMFAERAVAIGSLFLLKPADAVAYIDAGHSLGLTLAGVEGFTVYPERSVKPHQELSNDSADCHLSEEEFLESTKQLVLGVDDRANLAFEVVFETLAPRVRPCHENCLESRKDEPTDDREPPISAR